MPGMEIALQEAATMLSIFPDRMWCVKQDFDFSLNNSMEWKLSVIPYLLARLPFSTNPDTLSWSYLGHVMHSPSRASLSRHSHFRSSASASGIKVEMIHSWRGLLTLGANVTNP